MIAHVLGGETRAADVGWAVGVQETQVLSPAGMDVAVSRAVRACCRVTRIRWCGCRNARKCSRPRHSVPNSGFTIGDHILTFQGHPEFSKGYSRALIELRRELLGEPGYSEGVESLAKPVHHSMVGRWIINFIASKAADRAREAP